MKNKYLLFFGMVLLIGIVSGSLWVADPANCPNNYMSQTCSGNNLVCGYSGGITFCYDMASLNPPGSTTETDSGNYGTFDGGYVIDCYAYDGGEPHCDNSGAAWCDRKDSCYTIGRKTNCTGGVWNTATCTNCRTGFVQCDGDYTDPDGCEIQYDSDNCSEIGLAGANNNVNSTCDCVCNTDYCDCDSSGAGVGNGCENQSGASCTIGGASGTWDCTSCTCVAGKSYFETGTFTTYLIDIANGTMLWFKNLGTGNLINATNVNGNSFIVDNETNVITSGNVTSSWFKGIFNWIIGSTSSNYLSFNGTQLDFNETKLNETISDVSPSVSDVWVNESGDTMTGQLNLSGSNLYQNASSPKHVSSYMDTALTSFLAPTSVVVSGKYAYVGSYADDGLSIIDISDPVNPKEVGSIVDSGSLELDGVMDVFVAGKYAYVVSQLDHGFQIIDISNPSNPVALGYLSDGDPVKLNQATAVVVQGKYAYVAGRGDDALEIIDVSNPNNPTHVSSISHGGDVMLKEPHEIYVSGKYAYVVSQYQTTKNNGTLEIIDISDASNPTHMGAFADNATTLMKGASSIYVVGKYAYVCGQYDDGVQIMDVSNVSNPFPVGSISNGGDVKLDGAKSIIVSGDYAYVGLYDGDGVTVLDISNASNPTNVGSISNGGDVKLNSVRSMYLSGKYLYVPAYSSGALEILEITGADLPSARIGDLEVGSLNVINNLDIFDSVSIGTGLVVGLRGIFSQGDVSINGSLDVTGNATASWFKGIFNWVIGSSSTEYLSFNGTQLDFNETKLNETIDSYGGDSFVNVGGDTMTGDLNLSGGNFLQTSVNPTVKGGVINTTYLNGAHGVYVSGKYAYVAGHDSDSLAIIDISNPNSPSVTGGIVDPNSLDHARAVHVSGKYAYLVEYVATDAYFTIVDVSAPSSPSIMGKVKNSTYMGKPSAVYVSGKYAYVAGDDSDSLAIIDISNPNSPSVVGGVINSTYIDGGHGVYVSGKYAYLTGDNSHSVGIVDISDPTSPSVVGGVINTTYMANAKGVYVSGKYAYLTGHDSDSLAIIDISNPNSPSVVGGVINTTYMNNPRSVYVSGKYAYITGDISYSLAVVDISDPTSPSVVGGVINTTYMNRALSLYVSGKYAYIAAYTSDALAVIDISGLDSPSATIGDLTVGTLDVWENLDVYNDLSVGAGLIVGLRGIFSQGDVSINGSLEVTGNATSQVDFCIEGGNCLSSSASSDEPLWTANYSADQYVLNTGDTATGTYNFDTGTLYLNSTSHKVGIGVGNNPTTKLDVTNIIRTRELIEIGKGAVFNAYYDAGWKRRQEGYASYIVNQRDTDTTIFRVATTGAVDSAINWINALVINNSNGNIGIGATNPIEILQLGQGATENKGLMFTYTGNNYRNSIINYFDSGTAANNKMKFYVCNKTTTGQVKPLELRGDLSAQFYGNLEVTGNLSVDSNTLFVDSNNHKVLLNGVTSYASNDPILVIGGNRTGSGNAHAFVDEGSVDKSGTIGYNSFDHRITVIGSNDYDHFAGFQSSPTYSTSGSIDRVTGFTSAPTMTTGTIDKFVGYRVNNPQKSGGTINNLYGVFFPQTLTAGTNNWAIYVNGTTKSYFGGNVTIGAASWFKGIFNWIIGSTSSNYLSFNGTQLDFNETKLNETIDSYGGDSFVNVGGDTMTGNLVITKQGINRATLTLRHAKDGDTGRARFAGERSRGTKDIPTDLVNDDYVTEWVSYPYIDSDFRKSASIKFNVDGTPSASSWPGEIEFRTVVNGSTTNDLRMIIRNDGKVGINTFTPQNNLNVVGDINATGNYIQGANTGITGNYSTGNCWFDINGGIITSTNCTAL